MKRAALLALLAACSTATKPDPVVYTHAAIAAPDACAAEVGAAVAGTRNPD